MDIHMDTPQIMMERVGSETITQLAMETDITRLAMETDITRLAMETATIADVGTVGTDS